MLTDDLVEKGAMALHVLGGRPIEACRAEARACLAAALPDILEECARVIEDTPSRLFAVTHHAGKVHESALNTGSVKRELADRIRSLFKGIV